MSKNYVAVRTAYYKHHKLSKKVKKRDTYKSKGRSNKTSDVTATAVVDKTYKSAMAEFDHVLRLGKTNSVNVHDEFSYLNVTVSPKNCDSPLDAYFKCREKYKSVTGRNCRNDMNTLFEHVVVLSSSQVHVLEEKLGREKATKAIVTCLKNYSKRYAEECGFTNLGFSYHAADEGHYDEHGIFVRNVHAHVMFFNYDFKNKQSNLKHLMKKGKNSKTGKTNELNKNFVFIQDLAYECFKPLNFNRGQSKLLTMAKYLPKSQYLEKILSDKKSEIKNLIRDINLYRTNFEKRLKDWFKSLWNQQLEEEILQEQMLDEALIKIVDKNIQGTMKNSIEQNKEEIKHRNKRRIR